MRAAERLKRENRLLLFKPYPRQAEFFNAGSVKRERLLMAGNQVGKSEAGAYETACHLTGIYPDWWKGKRFHRPIKAWALGETSIVVRDVQQKKLCGEPGVDAAFGTGMIPKDLFADRPSLARGITDAFDTIQVTHASGGVSVLKFKSYEQGRAKLQGETVDVVWPDEEPPEDVYGEVLARLTGQGICYITFTPLKGRSAVVRRFMDESSPQRQITSLPLSEVKHFTDEEKRQRVEGYAAHERGARERGEPLLGSGGVYTSTAIASMAEDQIRDVPVHWAKLWGIDFGIDHPFAAVLMAWDRDDDVMHVLYTVRLSGGVPLQHVAAMRQVAANVPVAWPHDGTQRDKGSGEELAAIYKRHGLNMIAEHSTWPTGGYGREPAVLEIEQRATMGKFKVASHLSDWFQEARMYHRKDGQIVRVEDDLMSATEKVVMMKRHARAVGLGSKVVKRRPGLVALGTEDEQYWGM